MLLDQKGIPVACLSFCADSLCGGNVETTRSIRGRDHRFRLLHAIHRSLFLHKLAYLVKLGIRIRMKLKSQSIGNLNSGLTDKFKEAHSFQSDYKVKVIVL